MFINTPYRNSLLFYKTNFKKMIKQAMKPIPYTRASLRHDLPKRNKSDSKVQGGKVCVVAGSPGMWGAAVLAAQGASRCGAGYVFLLASTQGNLLQHPDFLASTEGQLKKLKFSSAVLGPGYRKPKSIGRWVSHWIKTGQKNVILDAEALQWLARQPTQKLPADWILTPHEGEMGRLLGKSRNWVHAHRKEAVILAQMKWQCIVVLKGAATLIADGKKIYSVTSGNPALGKAGSGDVLAGMIAAFLAQKGAKVTSLRAVCAAAFVHGWIADKWIKSKKDVLALRPTDLLAEIPFALSVLRK
jgi:ADP-dependent NAD(P)H-hydrate dehydratase